MILKRFREDMLEQTNWQFLIDNSKKEEYVISISVTP